MKNKEGLGPAKKPRQPRTLDTPTSGEQNRNGQEIIT
jgi:hypothetical protein